MASRADEPDDDFLAAEDALEEFEQDGDRPMDSGDEAEAGDNGADNDENHLTLQNDSVAYFDRHRDSVFAIAQHPLLHHIIAAGGSDGPEDKAPGRGYVIDTSAARRTESTDEPPVLPASYNADPVGARQTTELRSVFDIEGHSDSVNALAWTLPGGDALLSAGLDGRLRAYRVDTSSSSPDRPPAFVFLAEAREVPEINWLAPCPSADNANTVALGASDGSVWVYTVDPSAASADSALTIVQSYFLHTESCTAGAWTPDGSLLVTISEDGSLYAWDVWGLAAAKGLAEANGATVMSLTSADQRFAVEGGLFALAVEPASAYVAVGGGGGAIRIVSLPRVGGVGMDVPNQQNKSKGGRKGDSAGAGGQILASLKSQSDGVETLSFTTATATTAAAASATTLLASGSVDGSIAVFDATNRFALRRLVASAHDGLSVVKVDFVPGTWTLTSCGMDGAVRRWDLRGSTGAATGAAASATVSTTGGAVAPGTTEAGLAREWKGHRGGGEGGGVLGFVQGEGNRVVTAGDDGLVLVFDL